MAEGRSGPSQAVAQVATLAITTAISGLGGLVTGLLMRAVGRAQFRWGVGGGRGYSPCRYFTCRGEAVIIPEYERFNDHSTFLLSETDQKEAGDIEV